MHIRQLNHILLSRKYLDIGITNGNINDVSIRVYDRERCICDLIRYANKFDREMVNQAIHRLMYEITIRTSQVYWNMAKY